MHRQICSYHKLFSILRWELTLYCPGSLPLYSNSPYQGKKPPGHKRIPQNSEKLGPHPSKCENKRRHWVFSDIQLLSWNITTTLCNKWHRLWNSEKQRCLTNAIGSLEWRLSQIVSYTHKNVGNNILISRAYASQPKIWKSLLHLGFAVFP